MKKNHEFEKKFTHLRKFTKKTKEKKANRKPGKRKGKNGWKLQASQMG